MSVTKQSSIYRQGIENAPSDGKSYVMNNGVWIPIGSDFEKWEIYDHFENVTSFIDNFIKIARDKTTGITIIQYNLLVKSDGAIDTTLNILSSQYCPISKPYVLSGTPFTCMGPISNIRNSVDNSCANFCVGAERCFIEIGHYDINNKVITGGFMTITDKNRNYV